MTSRALILLCVACKSHAAHDDAAIIKDARPIDAPAPWPELAKFPKIEPVKIVAIPARPSVPRFDVGGPAIAGDVAVVSSSQFGFVAVDYKRGQIAWTKPAGLHVAPPLARGGDFVLIGDCVNPPEEPALGCLRVVTPTGGDREYVAIHGKHLEDFANAAGPQAVWTTGERTVTWRRGDQAVSIDVIAGTATPAPAQDPPLVVHDKGRTWEITRTEEGLIAGRGKPSWQTTHPYTALIGAVYLPEQSPMIRVSNAGHYGEKPEMNLLDIDATGSLHGQVAFPVPGIALFGHAIDSVGDTALAIRLDASLERDFIVGYAANALLMWVYPLPRQQRADPVGLAVAPGAVVAFHDGDTLTILPELSSPPTAPGAVRPPSENTTP